MDLDDDMTDNIDKSKDLDSNNVSNEFFQLNLENVPSKNKFKTKNPTKSITEINANNEDELIFNSVPKVTHSKNDSDINVNDKNINSKPSKVLKSSKKSKCETPA